MKPRRRRWVWVVLGLGAVACGLWVLGPGRSQRGWSAAAEMVLYQAPGCPCCGQYVAHLRRAGYTVRVVESAQRLVALKDRLGIPPSLRSCHTVLVGGHFVEGHVPGKAIAELGRRASDWAGIALPGMPAGSPGMPGRRQGAFVVYGLTSQGQWVEFAIF